MTAYLFVTSRDNYEQAKKHSTIGFHDFVPNLVNVLPAVKIGDSVFFYITKEKVIASVWTVNKELYDDDAPLFSSRYQEPYSTRLGVDFEKTDKNVDFQYKLAPKMEFIKRKDIGYAAYLVSQFIKLSDKDESTIRKELSIWR